jgi:hypothetical protein
MYGRIDENSIALISEGFIGDSQLATAAFVSALG